MALPGEPGESEGGGPGRALLGEPGESRLTPPPGIPGPPGPYPPLGPGLRPGTSVPDVSGPGRHLAAGAGHDRQGRGPAGWSASIASFGLMMSPGTKGLAMPGNGSTGCPAPRRVGADRHREAAVARLRGRPVEAGFDRPSGDQFSASRRTFAANPPSVLAISRAEFSAARSWRCQYSSSSR